MITTERHACGCVYDHGQWFPCAQHPGLCLGCRVPAHRDACDACLATFEHDHDAWERNDADAIATRDTIIKARAARRLARRGLA